VDADRAGEEARGMTHTGAEATAPRRRGSTAMAEVGALWVPPDATDAEAARRVSGTEHLAGSERRLRLAMLWGAIEDLRRGAERARRGDPDDPPWRRQYLRTREWFAAAASTDDWPFAFVPLCDAVGLAPGPIRAQLLTEAPPVEAPPPTAQVERRLEAAGVGKTVPETRAMLRTLRPREGVR